MENRSGFIDQNAEHTCHFLAGGRRLYNHVQHTNQRMRSKSSAEKPSNGSKTQGWIETFLPCVGRRRDFANAPSVFQNMINQYTGGNIVFNKQEQNLLWAMENKPSGTSIFLADSEGYIYKNIPEYNMREFMFYQLIADSMKFIENECIQPEQLAADGTENYLGWAQINETKIRPHNQNENFPSTSQMGINIPKNQILSSITSRISSSFSVLEDFAAQKLMIMTNSVEDGITNGGIKNVGTLQNINSRLSSILDSSIRRNSKLDSKKVDCRDYVKAASIDLNSIEHEKSKNLVTERFSEWDSSLDLSSRSQYYYDFYSVLLFLKVHRLIPDYEGFVYVKCKPSEISSHCNPIGRDNRGLIGDYVCDDYKWHIVSKRADWDNNCMMMIKMKDLTMGFNKPAIMDIKLGNGFIGEYPGEAGWEARQICKEEALDKTMTDKCVRLWRKHKKTLRCLHNPVDAQKYIQAITPEDVGLDEYSNKLTCQELHSLLKRWRQKQLAERTTQKNLGFRICGAKFIEIRGNDSVEIEINRNVGINFTDEDARNAIIRFIGGRKEVVTRLLGKLLMLQEWLVKQDLFHFYATSLFLAYDTQNASRSDIRWLDFAHAHKRLYQKSTIEKFELPEARFVNRGIIKGIDELLNLMRRVMWEYPSLIPQQYSNHFLISKINNVSYGTDPQAYGNSETSNQIQECQTSNAENDATSMKSNFHKDGSKVELADLHFPVETPSILVNSTNDALFSTREDILAIPHCISPFMSIENLPRNLDAQLLSTEKWYEEHSNCSIVNTKGSLIETPCSFISSLAKSCSIKNLVEVGEQKCRNFKQEEEKLVEFDECSDECCARNNSEASTQYGKRIYKFDF